MDHAYAFGREYLAKEMPSLVSVLQALDREGGPPREMPSGRPRIGTEDWYGVEILETLFQLRGRIRKRELESSRNLPQFRVAIVCAELFEEYREDVRSKLVQAGCSKVQAHAVASPLSHHDKVYKIQSPMPPSQFEAKSQPTLMKSTCICQFLDSKPPNLSR